MSKTTAKEYKRLINKLLERFEKTFGTDLVLKSLGGGKYSLYNKHNMRSYRPYNVREQLTLREVLEALRWMYAAHAELVINRNATFFKRGIGFHVHNEEISYTIASKLELNIGKFNEFVVTFKNPDGSYRRTVRLERSENIPIEAILRQAREIMLEEEKKDKL